MRPTTVCAGLHASCVFLRRGTPEAAGRGGVLSVPGPGGSCRPHHTRGQGGCGMTLKTPDGSLPRSQLFIRLIQLTTSPVIYCFPGEIPLRHP